MKTKLAGQSHDDTDDIESVDTDDLPQRRSLTESTSTLDDPGESVGLKARPKRSSSRSTAEEEKLLSALDERGRQSLQLQEKLLQMVKPAAPVSERATFGDWAKAVMADLDPSLWRQFQQEQSQLLYKYLELNDKIKTQHTQQSSQCAQWQPPPQNWPTNVETTSVWNSMNTSWVQAQMQYEPTLTTLQPCMTSTPQNPPTSVAVPTATSPSDETETAVSGIIRDSFSYMN